MRRILIIGTGNMGTAILKQGMEKKIFTAGNLHIYDKEKGKTVLFQKANIKVHPSLDDVSEFSMVILAVKPGDIESVLKEIARTLNPDACVVSVAAGVTLAFIHKNLSGNNPVARIMPNLNALSGAGMSAICFDLNIPEKTRRNVTQIFSAIGEVVVVEEAKMDAVTGLSGSGPAFVFMFISSLMEGGIKAGLSHDEALKLALHTVEGSVKTVLKTGENPETLKDRVASPNGTTIEGIHVLENRGFQASVEEAVQAAAKRSSQISEKYK